MRSALNVIQKINALSTEVFYELLLNHTSYVLYSLLGKKSRNKISDKGKIAQEALDFEVLRYAQIAAEQKKLREERIHLAILCSPHNPTGRVWERRELEKAMELLKKQ